jgi:hypothetical protein
MNIASLKSRLLLCALIVLLFGFAGVFAGAEVGKPAPEISDKAGSTPNRWSWAISSEK